MLKYMKKGIAFSFVAISIAILAVVVGMTYKTASEDQKLLEESISAQLISIATAAKEYIPPQDFAKYKSDDDKDIEYGNKLANLRMLVQNVGAKYIYALRKDVETGKYFFVYDTDPLNDKITEYDIGEVHKKAFSGQVSAGIMNLQDEYGSFNTGATPVFNEKGLVVGVICVDIEDTYVAKSVHQTSLNVLLLILSIIGLIIIVWFVLTRLLSEIERNQDELERMAHYDLLTNLPNRQYLLEYLKEETTAEKHSEFAIYFVDLDNFKKVNDTAGHDAGDMLLRNISYYLKTAHANSKLFRPAAGKLNIAARIGGDEFILIAPGINNVSDAADFAAELIDGFNKSEIDNHIEKYGVGLSVGVALFPIHAYDYNVLIKCADIAMYHAKNSGKNCFMVYNEEMTPKDEK